MRRIKRNHLVEILLHILFWAAMLYTTGNSNKHFKVVRWNIKGEVRQNVLIETAYSQSLLTLFLLMVLFYSTAFWLLKKVMTFNSNIVRFVVVLGWTLLIFELNSLLTPLVMSPTPPPLNPFGPVHVTNVITFLSMLGIAIAYFFSKEWIKSDLLRKQIEANQLSTEIKFLKSQINPHFLFNTLNNLFSMAQAKGNDELADGISKLSGMMRYMIYESNAETVPLRKEIEYINSCIALNKLRYADDEAVVDFRYDEPIPELAIAPMLFIPFVENAFKHGVIINSTSFIDISITANDGALLFACSNKNHSLVKKMQDEKSGIGLENVKRRLDLLYPGKYNLEIKSDEGKFRVALMIDLS